MGRRGPPPLPLELRLKHGETRPSHLNLTEPKPRDSRPRMPGYLLEAAKPIWRATVREAPHLRAVDTDLLVAYCQTVAFYRAAKAIYDRAGGPGLMFRKGVHQGHGDQLIVHPIVGIMHDWSAEMVALGRELGLSPTSRARLGLTEPRPGDDIAATLGPARNRLAALPPPPEPGEA